MSSPEYMYPPMSQGGQPPYPGLTAAPQADWRNVDTRVLLALSRVAQELGQTITIISGYRSPAYSAGVGGYSTDPHTRGVAADAYIGSTPVGNYKGAGPLLAAAGLESGAQPNFYRGQPDPEHVQIPGSGVNKLIHSISTFLHPQAGKPAPLSDFPAQAPWSGPQVTGPQGLPAGASAPAGCGTVLVILGALWGALGALTGVLIAHFA